MKYCYECGHITDGEPSYCNRCGRSYDVRLCPRGHQNSRGAECCSQCGSRELSTPQPKIPMSWRLMALVIRLGLGLLLFYATLSFAISLLHTPVVQELLITFGLLLAGLWTLWKKLPDWMQEVLRSLWKQKGGSDD